MESLVALLALLVLIGGPIGVAFIASQFAQQRRLARQQHESLMNALKFLMSKWRSCNRLAETPRSWQ
ncbi:MAG: hypothetical protein R3B96_02245 [Pirellulaceae bacterium]